MMKINLQKNKRGPAQYRRRKSSGSGFVILFAVTLSALVLAIALGVSDIAFREARFSTNARETNEAFFAADTGAECALANDKTSNSAFVTGSGSSRTCNNQLVTITEDSPSFWRFTLSRLGTTEQGCAIVTVDKSTTPTTFISKGYNNGGSVLGACDKSSNSIERELKIIY